MNQTVGNAVPVLASVVDPSDTVNILIVDDEPANLLVLETVLSDPGYRLVRAASGHEALLELMDGDFAVLVLDIHMPEMTGLELARLVKERKRTARIPIIFLTAYYGEDQHVLAGYDNGAVDYLHKPVDATVLRAKVSVFAELHRKTLALEATNSALQAEVIERAKAEARLGELNESLDRKVNERTTALRQSEAQLLDADRRKDEFLATLAHELRNPLAPIRTAVHLLRMKGLDPAVLAKTSDVIDRQVRTMIRLIDDLMDVNRINRGRIELRRERVQVSAVLKDAMEATHPLIEECGHLLSVDEPGDPLFVDADRTRLAQAFSNLLSNAAKYMDRGGQIELTVRQVDGLVTVSCKDRGIGIAADKIRGVFDMFSQVESALSRSRGGLGIGLALTQRLVRLHGGEVVAYSEGLGAGSEFVIRLPPASDATVPKVDAPRVEAALTPGRRLRVLIADDNDDAATTTALLLKQQGHDVLKVQDGSEAVRCAADFRPDLALLDLGMPVLNGYEACAMIRRLPLGRRIGIVAVTGWGQAADIERSRRAGFDDHLVKPVEPTALLDLIAHLTLRDEPFFPS